MKMKALLFICIFAAPIAGCATNFNGSAPSASPQKVYVVGAKANHATVWVCPTTGGDCHEVDVAD